MKTKTIRQSVTFKASPHAVYETLMDSRKHTRFTGAKAKISRKVNGGFTTYDGYIEGVHLDLVPGKKIVQSWRGSDWPEGHFSKATFSLKKIKTARDLLSPRVEFLFSTIMTSAKAGVITTDPHEGNAREKELRRRLKKKGQVILSLRKPIFLI